jgi:hypothetical protein
VLEEVGSSVISLETLFLGANHFVKLAFSGRVVSDWSISLEA